MIVSPSHGSGCLVAVVGPSGAGKDTLIDAARAALAGDPRFGFVRRVITRPADAGGEDHQAMSRQEFAEARQNGAFALHWHAHGLDYGIPAEIHGDLARGRVMVANLSRREIPLAEAVFPHLVVVEITAAPAVLAQRLAGRGRETVAEIEARLAREVPLKVAHARHVVIRNERPVADVAAEFVNVIRTSAA